MNVPFYSGCPKTSWLEGTQREKRSLNYLIEFDAWVTREMNEMMNEQRARISRMLDELLRPDPGCPYCNAESACDCECDPMETRW